MQTNQLHIIQVKSSPKGDQAERPHRTQKSWGQQRKGERNFLCQSCCEIAISKATSGNVQQNSSERPRRSNQAVNRV